MAKAVRRIREYLGLIDIVVEVVDARIPRSGRNPILDELTARRTRIVTLDRADLADPATTKRWLSEFAQRGIEAVAVDARAARSVAQVAGAIERAPSRKAPRGIARAMIVGVPNSGKSSVINALVRRAAAKTEDRAGVTRQLQWFRLSSNVELMDTPGLLPPKISGSNAQWKLAICGAVPRALYDPAEVANAFARWISDSRPLSGVPDLQSFAEARGFKRHGGEIDYHNAAQSYIRAFNEGAFGRISLEAPDDAEAA